MAPRLYTQERRGYADGLARMWSDLARTLRRLDELAAAPDEALAAEAAGEELARLRYSLHVASERVAGLAPPRDAAEPHEDFAEALAGARDVTAEIAETLEAEGSEAAGTQVWEWRGALFRVRLAWLRLTTGGPAPAGDAQRPRHAWVAPAVAFALTLVGATSFVLGATLAAWPIWVAGLLAVVAGLLAYRP